MNTLVHTGNHQYMQSLLIGNKT